MVKCFKDKLAIIIWNLINHFKMVNLPEQNNSNSLALDSVKATADFVTEYGTRILRARLTLVRFISCL